MSPKNIKTALVLVVCGFLLGCSDFAGRVLNDDGETIILANDQSCTGATCIPTDLEPIIDYTDLENVTMEDEESEDIVVDEFVSEEIEDNVEACDSQTDKDGDGVPCSCDLNDESARIYAMTEVCDTDGDSIPNSYDLCPTHDDSETVTTIYLCDDDEDVDGILSEVDYDDTRWTELSCSGTSTRFARRPLDGSQIDTVESITPKIQTNFPIAYVFSDENGNEKADGCDFIRRVEFFRDFEGILASQID